MAQEVAQAPPAMGLRVHRSLFRVKGAPRDSASTMESLSRISFRVSGRTDFVVSRRWRASEHNQRISSSCVRKSCTSSAFITATIRRQASRARVAAAVGGAHVVPSCLRASRWCGLLGRRLIRFARPRAERLRPFAQRPSRQSPKGTTKPTPECEMCGAPCCARLHGVPTSPSTTARSGASSAVAALMGAAVAPMLLPCTA